MIVHSFVVLAVAQIALANYLDNEHIITPADAARINLSQAGKPCGFTAPPATSRSTRYHQSQFYCNQNCQVCQPCIQSLTKINGPVLQSSMDVPLLPEPMVPIIEHHIGHQIYKTKKHVPVVRKYCRPELVIRTRHVPVVKHRRRVITEPYMCHVPITDKLIRQVIHEIIHKLPVVHKWVRPILYKTIRHVPASCVQHSSCCSPGCIPSSNANVPFCHPQYPVCEDTCCELPTAPCFPTIGE